MLTAFINLFLWVAFLDKPFHYSFTIFRKVILCFFRYSVCKMLWQWFREAVLPPTWWVTHYLLHLSSPLVVHKLYNNSVYGQYMNHCDTLVSVIWDALYQPHCRWYLIYRPMPTSNIGIVATLNAGLFPCQI
jgi:hypothetical protein